jgi:hypothetical protein
MKSVVSLVFILCSEQYPGTLKAAKQTAMLSELVVLVVACP